jgi:hypothetical protein
VSLVLLVFLCHRYRPENLLVTRGMFPLKCCAWE